MVVKMVVVVMVVTAVMILAALVLDQSQAGPALVVGGCAVS